MYVYAKTRVWFFLYEPTAAYRQRVFGGETALQGRRRRAVFVFGPRWRDNKSRVAATGCKSLCVYVCAVPDPGWSSSVPGYKVFEMNEINHCQKPNLPPPKTLHMPLQPSGVREFNFCALSSIVYVHYYTLYNVHTVPSESRVLRRRCHCLPAIYLIPILFVVHTTAHIRLIVLRRINAFSYTNNYSHNI